ncbi:helix-turn-helix domain-containing protein [Paenibacillus tarimensis]
MGRVKGYPIFIKYLVTYLMVLLLPISAMTFVVYNVFVDRLQKEVIAGNQNTLDKVRQAVDEQFKRLEDTTYQMMLKQNQLSQYRVSDDPGYKAWGIVNELKRYYEITPFIHEIWLYYRGESSVYTNKSVYSFDILTEIYPFEDWTDQQITQDLNTLSTTEIRQPAAALWGQDRLMRILIPILPYQDKHYATLVYLIKESAIQKLLSNQVQTGGLTLVLDRDNRLLTGVGADGKAQEEMADEIIGTDSNQSDRIVSIGGEDHYLFTVQSDQTGWKFVTLLPVRFVLDDLKHAQRVFQYGITFVLLIGGLIIFLSMRWNYRPIRQLKLETERMYPSETRPLNELETVRHALSSLAQENRKLDERVKYTSAAAKNQSLLALLKGDFTSAEELRLYGEETDFPVQGTLFRVAIVELPANPDRERRLAVGEMEKLLPLGLPGYGMEHVDRNRCVFLLIVDGIDEDFFARSIEFFREELRTRTEGPITLGVGSIAELSGIPRSYLEADTATDYRFIQGNDQTIYYGDIPTNRLVLEEYPHQGMEQLLQSIRSGNAAKAELNLSAMLDYVRTNHPPVIVARSLCYDIIRTVNKAWSDMGLDDQGSSNYPDVFTLERLETLDDFERLIRSVCVDICSILEHSEQDVEESVRSVDSMINYILKNYRNCDFSFQNMARDYGMALPNMSQYFKSQTSLTLLDYTTNLRMETAKQLLADSDLPLKVVAEEVGYYNVSSFIRRFKQLEDVTPGEYRQRFQNDRVMNG